MESLEKAIRTAFDKGDPLDPAYRKRVYRSALTALEKSASANPSVTEEVAASRREKLKDVIRSIETEFRPAAAPASQPEPQPEPPAAQEPPVEAEAADVPTVEASVPEVAPVEADVAPDVEPVDDMHLTALRKERLRLKDEIYGMLNRHEPVPAMPTSEVG